MKIVALIFLMCMICSCGSSIKSIQKSEGRLSYRIYKIDSVGNFFLLYAKRNDIVYKIVSDKITDNPALPRIRVGKKYNLELRSLKSIQAENGIHLSNFIDCHTFDSISIICVETPKMRDLHFAQKSISGLRYLQ